MPKYRIKNPDTGEERIVERPNPPSQEDAAAMFAPAAPAALAPRPSPDAMASLREMAMSQEGLGADELGEGSPVGRTVGPVMAGLSVVGPTAAALPGLAGSAARVAMSPAGAGVIAGGTALANGAGLPGAVMTGLGAAGTAGVGGKVVEFGSRALMARLGHKLGRLMTDKVAAMASEAPAVAATRSSTPASVLARPMTPRPPVAAPGATQAASAAIPEVAAANAALAEQYVAANLGRKSAPAIVRELQAQGIAAEEADALVRAAIARRPAPAAPTLARVAENPAAAANEAAQAQLRKNLEIAQASRAAAAEKAAASARAPVREGPSGMKPGRSRVFNDTEDNARRGFEKPLTPEQMEQISANLKPDRTGASSEMESQLAQTVDAVKLRKQQGATKAQLEYRAGKFLPKGAEPEVTKAAQSAAAEEVKNQVLALKAQGKTAPEIRDALMQEHAGIGGDATQWGNMVTWILKAEKAARKGN